MKKRKLGISALILIIAFSVILSPACVFAGNINSHEAGVIAYGSQTFEYKGVKYVATQASKDQLRAYLLRDDIDLNADQAARAKSMISSNVKTGVEEGYIMPVGGQAPQKPDLKEEEAGNSTVIIDTENSGFTVESPDNENVFTGKLPVKNTGFNIESLVILLAAILLILPAAVIVSYRKGFFAHYENER